MGEGALGQASPFTWASPGPLEITGARGQPLPPDNFRDTSGGQPPTRELQHKPLGAQMGPLSRQARKFITEKGLQRAIRERFAPNNEPQQEEGGGARSADFLTWPREGPKCVYVQICVVLNAQKVLLFGASARN